MADNSPWVQVKMSYDSSNNLTRMGKHKNSAAKTIDAGWYLWTFTYDANGNLIQKSGPTIGTWG